MPPIVSIPTPSGGSISFKEIDSSVAQMYVQDIRKQCEEKLFAFKYQYRKVKIRVVVLEGDDIATVLLKYVSYSRTRSLVLGSTNYFSRKPRDSEVPSIVLKNAPDGCNVYVISGNKLMLNSRDEGENDPRSWSQQDFSLSPSFAASSDKFISGDGITSPQAQASTSSSMFFGDTSLKKDDPKCKKSVSPASRVKRSQSIPSTCSEQSGTLSEIEQLRQELVSTLKMYNQACEELVHAQNKVDVLSSECIQEAEKVHAAQRREEILRKIAAEAKEKYVEAQEEVERAKEILEKERNERQIAELKAEIESLEKRKIVDALFSVDKRYRRYTREDIEKATDSFSENKVIGEGAYGKVYKGSLDHTTVAIKVLHPDASKKKDEFLKEVEVLSQLHHPNIVCLLGACPEIGGLVYEYMENGNLEDHLVHRKDRAPLPWPVRFKIAFEVACGLAFLHHSKPEPIVHRDLKPGNVLLDKYFKSKIGDVGLAKIISDVVPDYITEYRDSVVSGTFYYMDPEYSRTGTLRPKSDLYSFGVTLLQLLSSRYPNGLILQFENAVKNRCTFSNVLDKSVADWPLPETEELARLALQCCQLRCRDRPDLESEVLPVLKRLVEFADSFGSSNGKPGHPPLQFKCPILQETMDDPHIAADGFTYELVAIRMWLQMYDVSPVTKQKLQHKILIPNRMLHSAIQEWRKEVKMCE